MKRALAAAATACLLIAGCGGTSRTTPPSTSYTGSVHPRDWGKPIAGPNGLQRKAATPTGTAPITATMYDTVTVATIPPNPFAVAGYTAGSWPTYNPLRQAFPLAHAVSIAIGAGYHAACLDVEPGDAGPSQAPGWVRADIAAGFPHPCVYSSLWEFLNQVIPALNAGGIPRSAVFEWDADFTYAAHLDSGFDATQYSDRCLGLNLDCSLVTLPFLSIAAPPYQPAPPPPPPDPYALFLHHAVPLHHRLVDEYLAAQRWDALRCANPVKRPICADLRFDLELAAGRIHALVRSDRRHDWFFARRHRRFADLVLRITLHGRHTTSKDV